MKNSVSISNLKENTGNQKLIAQFRIWLEFFNMLIPKIQCA